MGTDETQAVRTHLTVMGRDEMNLAEFPLGTLASRAPRGRKTLTFEDRIWDKSRREHVTRRLTISGSDRYGLPTTKDDEVILGLIQLSKADGFSSRQVPFSRYQLIHVLGWRDEGKSYSRLEESLNRWLGVTLYYQNAWRDKLRGCWVDASFHLLESLVLHRRRKGRGIQIAGRPELPLSSFTWNEIVFRSFHAGYLRKLDMHVYRSLKLATAKRLYRFLDKRFHHSNRLNFSLKVLACDKVGLSRGYDAAQLKRCLSPAIEELERAGFLVPMSVSERFSRVSRGEWEIRFVRAARVEKPSPERAGPSMLEGRLMDRGVTACAAARLVRDYPADRVDAQIKVFDRLSARGDVRVSRNPAGYLVESIRRDYVPPPGFGQEPRAGVLLTAASDGRGTRGSGPAERASAGESYDDLERSRVEVYLSSLTLDKRSETVREAIAKARGIPAEGYRRAMDAGNGPLATQYREAIIQQHVRSLLVSAAASCRS